MMKDFGKKILLEKELSEYLQKFGLFIPEEDYASLDTKLDQTEYLFHDYYIDKTTSVAYLYFSIQMLLIKDWTKLLDVSSDLNNAQRRRISKVSRDDILSRFCIQFNSNKNFDVYFKSKLNITTKQNIIELKKCELLNLVLPGWQITSKFIDDKTYLDELCFVMKETIKGSSTFKEFKSSLDCDFPSVEKYIENRS